MNDDNIQKAIRRANRAKALLEDDLLQEILATMERNYIDKWRQTLVSQSDSRERLWQAVNIVGLVRDHLGFMVDDGKIAQAELNKLAAEEEKKKARAR